jgi:glucose 1-dehydrogenase
MTRTQDMAGRWAVVTGGSGGIGLGIATALVRAGGHVIMVARTPSRLEEAATGLQELAGPGQRVLTFAADLSVDEEIDAFFSFVESEVDQLHTFVANVGGGYVKDFFELERKDWNDVLELNVLGPFLVSQRAARLMRDRGGENQSIVLVSSIRSHSAKPGRAVYAATKAAMNQMMRVMALELAPHQIRVNALLPGITATELTMRNRQAYDEAIGTVPLGRGGDPADMGNAVLFLAGESGRFVTGVELPVDGGEVLR